MNSLFFGESPELLEACVHPVNRFSQFVVFVGNYIAGIVRVEMKSHRVVDVRPIGMVLLSLGVKSHFGHKSKGFFEVFELKGGD